MKRYKNAAILVQSLAGQFPFIHAGKLPLPLPLFDQIRSDQIRSNQTNTLSLSLFFLHYKFSFIMLCYAYWDISFKKERLGQWWKQDIENKRVKWGDPIHRQTNPPTGHRQIRRWLCEMRAGENMGIGSGISFFLS